MYVQETDGLPLKIWANAPEQGAIDQATDLARLPFARHWIALMPDTHQGYGMPIGGVLATDQVIVPNAVGVDIGCGMKAIRTYVQDVDRDTLKAIMGDIRDAVPVGFNHHEVPQHWAGFDNAPDIPIIQAELPSARKQLGTLGGGNHFIEIQIDNEGQIWLMLHSGSRNFGYKTARVYHNYAIFNCNRWYSKVPNADLSFLPIDSHEGHEYYIAMNYCMEFARANRALMMERIWSIFQNYTRPAGIEFELDVHHNYARFENFAGQDLLIHRKGAISARHNELGIIPGSMGSNSYITMGKGNMDSFCSSSHGAGRAMSRAQAKKTLDLATERDKMSGIVHGLRNTADLDEAPGAYKNIYEVMNCQANLVDVVYELRPLVSIKG